MNKLFYMTNISDSKTQPRLVYMNPANDES